MRPQISDSSTYWHEHLIPTEAWEAKVTESKRAEEISQISMCLLSDLPDSLADAPVKSVESVVMKWSV